MPFTENTFFKPANGRYVGDFIGTEDGPPQTRIKDAGTPKERSVTEGTMLWNFQLYNQDGSPVVDPNTGASPAVVQGMSSQTMGVGRGVEAKARTWCRALLAAKGEVFDENMDPNERVRRALGARAILNFGRSAGGKDGTLKDIEPFSPQAVAPMAAPVTAAPGATASIPAVAAYAAASVEPDDSLPF